MPTARPVLPLAIRAVALLLLSFASLQLALGAAHAVFLARQGQGSTAALPPLLAWLAAVAAGVAVYAGADRLAGRVGRAGGD